MWNKAKQIVKTLQNAGFQAVFAGGCVRDKILGIDSHDIDIATSATPDQVESLFKKTIPVGKSFGVIIVFVDGEQFEVATFRSDGQYTDGRRPDSVEFSSIEEDAKRRDLTINGLFYDPIKDEVLDFVDGKKDIEAQVIRFIGDPEQRIAEDKLRILRAIRFSTRFKFMIDPDTFSAIVKHAPEITQISSERIRDELVKILHTRSPREAFRLLFETKLIDYILPEMRKLEGLEQPPEFHEGDVLEHTTQLLERLPEDASTELLLGGLFHDFGKAETQTFEDRIRFSGHDVVGAEITHRIMKRLKFDNDAVKQVCALVKNHMRFCQVQKMKVSKLKRFIGMDKFDEHMALHKADCLSSWGGTDNWDFINGLEFPPEEVKPPRLVTGHDLLASGMEPSSKFKEILTRIEDEQLEGHISSREEALELMRSLCEQK